MILYLDTSVWSSVKGDIFTEQTLQAFDFMHKNEVEVIISDVVLEELSRADKKIIDFMLKYPRTIQVTTTDQAITLAKKYIAAGALTNNSYYDALHIALSTINKVNALISWNFRHIANIKRTTVYNDVNLRNGYNNVTIYSPKQLNDK